MADKQQDRTELREAKQDNHQQMRELLSAEDFDEAAVRELARQQADNRVSMMAQRHETRQQIDAVLTVEQREKHQQLREMRQQHRGQKRGHFKGGQRGNY